MSIYRIDWWRAWREESDFLPLAKNIERPIVDFLASDVYSNRSHLLVVSVSFIQSVSGRSQRNVWRLNVTPTRVHPSRERCINSRATRLGRTGSYLRGLGACDSVHSSTLVGAELLLDQSHFCSFPSISTIKLKFLFLFWSLKRVSSFNRFTWKPSTYFNRWIWLISDEMKFRLFGKPYIPSTWLIRRRTSFDFDERLWELVLDVCVVR